MSSKAKYMMQRGSVKAARKDLPQRDAINFVPSTVLGTIIAFPSLKRSLNNRTKAFNTWGGISKILYHSSERSIMRNNFVIARVLGELSLQANIINLQRRAYASLTTL
ncbi:hypothetical protein CEXT_411441 [Caerostris extrusa]|uniref:Uncharacterized protein n=1 Tax=Caerostris extrusa TaxID=172846 RepID=A0AAV4QVP1_CAEEX|nr:hypothetical protein CEXT_411441 [Caerostris extrusa]